MTDSVIVEAGVESEVKIQTVVDAEPYAVEFFFYENRG